MNRHRVFSLLTMLMLLCSLLPISAAAGQNNTTKIETLLLQKFQETGPTDFIVRMAEQADLSPAYAMNWNDRGWFVYNTLRQTAARTQARVIRYLEGLGARYESYFTGNEVYVYAGTLEMATHIAAFPEVAAVEAARTYYIDPIIAKAPLPPEALDWGIVDTKADQFWSAFGAQGEGIVVANIDTGVQWNHPALDQAYKCGSDPTNPACWSDPSNICGGPMCDNNGHGTHTMGTMVGDDDPSLQYQVGMAPGAQWIACKGCESSSCSNSALNACADWIVAPAGNPNNRPHVVNNSWGGGGGNTWYQAKVQAWRAAGIFPAFSAGNSGPGCNTLGSPGDYQESFASAAHDSSRNIASFSSRGPSAFGHDPYTKPNISAPGVNVCSSVPTNAWNCGYSGTSMASPHSAGAVALLWSCNPSLIGQIDQTFEVLQDNANTPPAGTCGAPPDNEGNYTFGYGYLDVYAAGLLWCGETGWLDGHVYDAVTNQPIVGATVDAGGPTDTTDANGYYTMTLAVGTYTVAASHPLYTAQVVPGVVITTDTVTTQDFYLQPRGRLFGYVTDYDNGFPLEGATVTAEDGTWDETDATGYYEMYLDEGAYVVTATMQNYAPGVESVVIVSGQDTQQDFALQSAVAFIPSPLHVYVDWQTTYNTQAQVLNRLPTPYTFAFQEVPGGFIPALNRQPEYPLNPTVVPKIPLTTGIPPAGYVPTAGVSGGTPQGPWQARAAAPTVSMDNVYLDYEHKGYLLGGYGFTGGVAIYDADTNTWTTGATEPAPRIQYPVDGCLGFNASGEPVGILFNDTSSGATTLHRYNMATNVWDTPPVPAGFPANGLWAHDVVSMLRLGGQNVCYISGGATTPGGGNTSALYEYHPDTNTVVNLGNFSYLAGGFDFHASWYVPWIGSQGAICVGGGVNSSSVVSADTQCYDIGAGVFHAPNADLGPLPAGVWGMADGVLYENGDYQLWIANGADTAFALWPNSAYYSHNDGAWHIGPVPPTTVYRVEGTNIAANDGCSFYVVGGSSGGFTPTSGHNRNFSDSCPPVAGADCLWLGEVPTSTVIPPQGSFSPQIYFTATQAVGVNQPGDYYCGLTLSGNPAKNVLVTMTVLPDPNMGQVHGYVYDNCLGAPVEANIDIQNGIPITQTKSDKDTGYYSFWLQAGSYDVTFSAAGYLDYQTTVNVPPGGDLWMDVDIVPNRPCIAVDPDRFEVWVVSGTPVYTHSTGLDLINNGGQALNYVIHEFSGTPGLAQSIEVNLPAGPQTVPAGTAAAGGTYTPAPAMSYTIERRIVPHAPPDVLLVMADDGNGEPIRSQLQAYGDLGLVDVFDARSATPTLAQLLAYDVVLTWSNYVYANPTGMGDVLADYVDAGGRVINLMFSMGTHGWQMGGRFMTQNYTAVNGTSIIYAQSCLGTYDPTHPIMTTPDPISNVCDYYRLSGAALTPGSTEVARWQDNTVFIGVKDDRSVVSITGYVGQYRQWTGQMDDVLHNAILWMVVPPYQDVWWVWEDPVTSTVPAGTMGNSAIYFTGLYTDATPMPLGTYTATLIIEENDPVADEPIIPVIMHIVEQYVTPTANFASNSPVCFGQEVVFTNLTQPGVPPVTTYLWEFGDGEFSTEENPTHLYGAPGTYTVVLTACNSENMCDTAEADVEVRPWPEAGFTYAVNELEVTFTDASQYATAWLWDFGDGITDTVQNPVHTYAAEGTYTVTLWALNDCGADMAQQQVTVGVAPVAAFLASSPACLGEPTVFTNTTTGTPPIAYLWAFGDGITDTVENPIHTYAAQGTYTVTLDAANAYGASQATGVVEVLPLPEAGFTYLAYGLVVTFTNTSQNTTSWLWDFGDGITDTLQNPVHTYTAEGAYTVTLWASGPCGTAEASAVLEVSLCEAAEILTVTTQIEGCVVTFGAEVVGDEPFSYLWDFGPFGTRTEPNPVVNFQTSGTYSGTLAVSNCAPEPAVAAFSVTVNCAAPPRYIYLPVIYVVHAP